MTIERVLHEKFGSSRPVHGNDIQAYSCALGWYLAGDPLEFTLREDFEEELGWLHPYLEGRADLMATLMLGTRFLQYVGKEGVYYRRMLAATQEQWPRMHEKTATKLRGLETRLGSFFAGGVRDYRDQAPADAPVVLFPPFYSGDCTSQFTPIDAAFDWPEPTFGELDEDAKERIIEQVQDRPNSAKYGRGIPGVRLQKRTEATPKDSGDGIHRYQLQYGGPLGFYDLAGALDLWKTKHGKDMR
ncbi:hypothetical protein [Streptomyces sp. NPDC048332]|uniref:putative antirestriction adenine methyltransferase n=1 Tax=Streptomyces sp. NPDC048332 TaxID=3154619 RepID=UPI003428FE6D